MRKLAVDTDGFSGASLAGVARAAASHALERAVEESLSSDSPARTIMECLVKQADFYHAINDVANSQVNADGRFQDHSADGDGADNAGVTDEEKK